MTKNLQHATARTTRVRSFISSRWINALLYFLFGIAIAMLSLAWINEMKSMAAGRNTAPLYLKITWEESARTNLPNTIEFQGRSAATGSPAVPESLGNDQTILRWRWVLLDQISIRIKSPDKREQIRAVAIAFDSSCDNESEAIPSLDWANLKMPSGDSGDGYTLLSAPKLKRSRLPIDGVSSSINWGGDGRLVLESLKNIATRFGAFVVFCATLFWIKKALNAWAKYGGKERDPRNRTNPAKRISRDPVNVGGSSEKRPKNCLEAISEKRFSSPSLQLLSALIGIAIFAGYLVWRTYEHTDSPGHYEIGKLLLNSDAAVIPKISIYALPALLGKTGLGEVPVFSLFFTIGLFFKFYLARHFTGDVKFALLSLFLFPLATVVFKTMSLGFIVPNTWHNFTTIMVAPLTVLLHFYSIGVLASDGRKKLRATLLLIFLNSFVKPSFLLAWMPAYSLFAAYRILVGSAADRPRRLAVLSVPMFVAGLSIAASFLQNYVVDVASVNRSIVVDPFVQWNYFLAANNLSLRHVPLVFVLSLAYPIFVALSQAPPRESNASGLVFAWIQFALALVVYATFSEVSLDTGEAVFHGNFGWGVTLTAYILFLESYRYALANETSAFKFYLGKSVIHFHAFFGIVYVMRFMITGNYY